MMAGGEISEHDIARLKAHLAPLVGVQFEVLKLPIAILVGFEPSQIGTICGVLMDACIPQLDEIAQTDGEFFEALGLEKHEGILKDREGYPDFLHVPTDSRLELKLLYVDPTEAVMKQVETRREPSARLSQKVTMKNVDADRDALLLLAYQLQPNREEPELYCPTIMNVGVFSMIECIRARDHRLTESGGQWFGDYETPAILSRVGRAKFEAGKPVDATHYGRKESEGYDFNEDTNFGKLKRIPYQPLQAFLRDNGADYSVTGAYPDPWSLGRKGKVARELGLVDVTAEELPEAAGVPAEVLGE